MPLLFNYNGSSEEKIAIFIFVDRSMAISRTVVKFYSIAVVVCSILYFLLFIILPMFRFCVSAFFSDL